MLIAVVVALAAVLVLAAACRAELPEGVVVPLWPAESLAPGAGPETEKAEVSPKGEGTITRLSSVTAPTITLYRPAKNANGAAVIVCPGGGYSILAWDLEGTEICEWLNSVGVTGVLLKYRVPGQRDAALADAQRAIRVVRSRAKEWGVDPKRIGILGFSAGGHLAARAGTNYAAPSYKPVDACDEAGGRPDFAVLIYPAYLANKDETAIDSATLPVTAETPSTFIAIAYNDKFTTGALLYAEALKKAKTPGCEVHVFATGGHGCGLRPVATEAVTAWPEHAARWMRDIRVTGEPAAEKKGE
jgi:acetyl esterase/lipase